MLDQDVAEIWRARIEGAFKDLAAASAGSQGGMAIGVGGISGVAAIAGRGREEERERREREARSTFVVSWVRLGGLSAFITDTLACVARCT